MSLLNDGSQSDAVQTAVVRRVRQLDSQFTSPVRVVFTIDRDGQMNHDARTPRRLVDDSTFDFLDVGSDDSPLVVAAKDGKLSAFRLKEKMPWRRLGTWLPAHDFNRDDKTDFLPRDGVCAAISGMDGAVLWQSDVSSDAILSPPLPMGDLDGNEVPDVIAFELADAKESSLHIGGAAALHALSMDR